MRKRWCDQCHQDGHRKWLWLGTHRTHRIYIRYKMARALRQAKKLSKESYE